MFISFQISKDKDLEVQVIYADQLLCGANPVNTSRLSITMGHGGKEETSLHFQVGRGDDFSRVGSYKTSFFDRLETARQRSWLETVTVQVAIRLKYMLHSLFMLKPIFRLASPSEPHCCRPFRERGGCIEDVRT